MSRRDSQGHDPVAKQRPETKCHCYEPTNATAHDASQSRKTWKPGDEWDARAAANTPRGGGRLKPLSLVTRQLGEE